MPGITDEGRITSGHGSGGGGGGGGGTGVDGDPLFIPVITTDEAIGAVLRQIVKSMELPRALSRLAEILKRSADAEANHIAQQAISSATAAYNDEQAILNGLYAVASYAGEVARSEAAAAAASSLYYYGTATVAFLGGAGEDHDSSTVTVDHASANVSWVTATSTIFGVIPYSPLTSDPKAYFFQVAPYTIVPATSFKFHVYNENTPFATTYTINWIAFP